MWCSGSDGEELRHHCAHSFVDAVMKVIPGDITFILPSAFIPSFIRCTLFVVRNFIPCCSFDSFFHVRLLFGFLDMTFTLLFPLPFLLAIWVLRSLGVLIIFIFSPGEELRLLYSVGIGSGIRCWKNSGLFDLQTWKCSAGLFRWVVFSDENSVVVVVTRSYHSRSWPTYRRYEAGCVLQLAWQFVASLTGWKPVFCISNHWLPYYNELCWSCNLVFLLIPTGIAGLCRVVQTLYDCVALLLLFYSIIDSIDWNDDVLMQWEVYSVIISIQYSLLLLLWYWRPELFTVFSICSCSDAFWPFIPWYPLFIYWWNSFLKYGDLPDLLFMCVAGIPIPLLLTRCCVFWWWSDIRRLQFYSETTYIIHWSIIHWLFDIDYSALPWHYCYSGCSVKLLPSGYCAMTIYLFWLVFNLICVENIWWNIIYC